MEHTEKCTNRAALFIWSQNETSWKDAVSQAKFQLEGKRSACTC